MEIRPDKIALFVVGLAVAVLVARLGSRVFRDAVQQASSRIGERWRHAGVIGLVALGTVVRLAIAASIPVDSDETFCGSLSHQVREGQQFDGGDYLTKDLSANPPLHCLYAMPLSLDGPRTMRLVSVAAGAGSVALGWSIATTLSGPAAGIGAGLLLALHPMAVSHGAMNRAYALGGFMLLLALAAVLRARREQSSESRMTAALLVAALVWTHYLLVVMAAGLVVWVMVEASATTRRGAWMRPFALAALLASLLTPWAVAGFQNKARLDRTPTVEMLQTGTRCLVGTRLVGSTHRPRLPYVRVDDASAFPLYFFAALLVLSALAWLAERREERGVTMGLLILLLFAGGGPVLLGQYVATVRDEHLFAVLPVAVLLLSALFERARASLTGAAGVAFAVGSLVVVGAGFFQGYRQLAQLVAVSVR